MATAPTFPAVLVEQYLDTSYDPDMEYVDGALVERSVPTYFHSLLQIIVGAYLRQFEKQYHFKVLPELRTQIIERARYRIPDLLMCATPTPMRRIMTVTPLAVIEILSPTDAQADVMARFQDYEHIAVPTIIQMDPEQCVSYRYEAGSLLKTRFDSIPLHHVNDSVPFDSEALFAQLRREIEESAAEM